MKLEIEVKRIRGSVTQGEAAVYVNGEKYQTDKSYFRKDVQMPLTVPEGQLFVLGDNGDESADSRNSYVGLVDAGTVKGVAIQ